MLFIFFDFGSPLSFWLSVALVIVIIIFHAQIFHLLLYILSIPVIAYSIIRWAILKLLEAYGVVEEKPRYKGNARLRDGSCDFFDGRSCAGVSGKQSLLVGHC